MNFVKRVRGIYREFYTYGVSPDWTIETQQCNFHKVNVRKGTVCLQTVSLSLSTFKMAFMYASRIKEIWKFSIFNPSFPSPMNALLISFWSVVAVNWTYFYYKYSFIKYLCIFLITFRFSNRLNLNNSWLILKRNK